MEEPGPPMNDLFQKMKQLFPEIPLPVIQFNVLCYGLNPPMCQHMLELHRQYLASSPTSTVSPIGNQLHGLNINTNFKESAIGQETNHRPESGNGHSLNLSNPQFPLIPNASMNAYTETKGKNRNLSYAGMSPSYPQILIPNPVLSAPVTSNAFHISPNFLQPLNQPTSVSRSGSPSAAFLSTVTDSFHPASPSVAQSFCTTDVSSHTADKSKLAWETYPATNSPLKAPYDSQLCIDIEPFYEVHFPNSDGPHSPYSNVYFPSTLNQHPLQPSSGFAHGTSDHGNSPFIRNDIFSAEDYQPHLIIFQKNCNADLQNVSPNGQQLSVGQMSVPTGSNMTYNRHNVQDHLHHQTSNLNALKYETLQNRSKVDLHNSEIQKLERQLKYKTYLPDKKMVQEMKDEISRLRVECHYLCMEVDLQLKGKAPLGMVDEDFYRTIFTGQQGPLLPDTTQDSSSSSPSSTIDRRQACIEEEEENEESSTWECSRCTFANHPAISVCEMCHIPRSTLPGLSEPESLLKHDPSDGGTM